MLHLIHPMLVHFTLAFAVVGGACEALGIVTNRRRVEAFGAPLVLIGTIALIPTVATGLLAENTVPFVHGVESDLEWHERLGFVVLGVFLISQVWKAWHQGRLPASQRHGYAVLLLTGVALILISAYLGGELVYGHGLGVTTA